MGLFKSIKAIKDAVSSGTFGGEMTPEQREAWLASLTPEQRAQVEANEAKVAESMAQQSASQVEVDELYQAQIDARPLGGPAGTFLYGRDPRDMAAEQMKALQEGGVMGAMKASWRATSASARMDEVQAAMPPVEVVSANSAEQIAHEWRQREQARGPYLAPARFPVLFTRIATRAGEAPDAVARHLAETGLSGRPELVFGLYPVPDHIGSGLTRRKNRYVEWEVVHAATEPLPASDRPGHSYLDGDEQWVGRASGEPSVLDEDLAVTVLAAAGVGPERCMGIGRAHATEAGGGGEGTESYVKAVVPGVHLFHAGDGAVGAAVDQLRRDRPVGLAAGPPPGVHVEVMNWRAIASVVQQRTGIAFLVPSPFPYLPSTPQELIKAYIDIVGVNPFDCYAAHVAEEGLRDLKDRDPGSRWTSMERTTGRDQPCVDGTFRPRLTGGSVVVVAYRDRPEYADGRARWAAYETDVLQARLANGTGARAPVTAMEYGSLRPGVRGIVRSVEKVAGVVDDLVGDAGSAADPFDRVPPHRYCWPPTDVR